ncbi:divalent-cation tolerance protein CutA [Desulfonatronovibrio hydrogenovorans]|uniref:divalent-cation tolerance protein CutA n=1 Tax=Desulfonatronovibrio hydrogenovorans TaxID=53245 RepID=UPI00048A9D39|nr:divalent-cation tolerance protein CutA [Desulfonatronovibrio hydrogenovorans]
MQYSFVYITASDLAEAENIGQVLVREKLAACVNIFQGMKSIYMWQGKLEESREAVLLAKTREDLREKLLARVKDVHSYECPCVVFIPVAGGNPEFLEWIGLQTTS